MPCLISPKIVSDLNVIQFLLLFLVLLLESSSLRYRLCTFPSYSIYVLALTTLPSFHASLKQGLWWRQEMLTIILKDHISLTSCPYWFGLGCFENEKMLNVEMQLIPNE